MYLPRKVGISHFLSYLRTYAFSYVLRFCRLTDLEVNKDLIRQVSSAIDTDIEQYVK